MEELCVLRAEITDTIEILIVGTSSPEVTRLRALMTAILEYSAEIAIGPKEEGQSNLRLTSIEFTERVRLTRSAYSPGRYASEQRGRLMKWRAASARR